MKTSGSTSHHFSEVGLVCHCLPAQARHADYTILECKLMCPQADDTENHRGMVPSSEELNRLAQLRLEPDSDEGSSTDEGSYPANSGWVGTGSPLRVGSGYTCGHICDGKLSRPLDAGQWKNRRYPEDACWTAVASICLDLPRRVVTPTLLSSFAMGKVSSPWQRNYSSPNDWSDKVVDVLNDQSSRGQIIKLPEVESRIPSPDPVVASLGAQRKDKPDGIAIARVLFDGTHGISVNTRTRIRDQERALVTSDLTRIMREKALVGERTFSLTADVAVAHRQKSTHRSA